MQLITRLYYKALVTNLVGYLQLVGTPYGNCKLTIKELQGVLLHREFILYNELVLSKMLLWSIMHLINVLDASLSGASHYVLS